MIQVTQLVAGAFSGPFDETLFAKPFNDFSLAGASPTMVWAVSPAGSIWFSGEGFSDAAVGGGLPTVGVVNSVEVWNASGQNVVRIAGLSISAAMFRSAVETAHGQTDRDAFFAALFSDDVRFSALANTGVAFTGGDGDDTIAGGVGADTLSGGLGFDWLNYNGSAQGVTVNLAASFADGGHARGDVISGFEAVTASNGDDAIGGDDDANRFQLWAGADQAWGHGGDDSIDGGWGADTLHGGDGDDTLNGGADGDQLGGGDGADELSGGDGRDWMYGHDGDDMLDGGAEGDLLDGGEDFDTVIYHGSLTGVQVDIGFGNASGDEAQGDRFVSIEAVSASNFADGVWGTDGDNVLRLWQGDDWAWGRGGADTIAGGWGADRIRGGQGRDLLDGDQGDDTLNGDDDDDTLNGGDGADQIGGDAGSDSLSGGDGDDWMWGGGDGDTLYGGDGVDNMRGGAGDDGLQGDDGDDVLNGDGGADTLFGGAGDDQMGGGGGADVLISGAGDDHMWGGAGADVFRPFGAFGADVIHDFEVAVDRIDLSAFETIDGMDAADLQIIDTGFGVLIAVRDQGQLTLANVTAAQLDPAHFLFAGSVVQRGDDDANQLNTTAAVDIMYGFGGADDFIVRREGGAEGAPPDHVDVIMDFDRFEDRIDLREFFGVGAKNFNDFVAVHRETADSGVDTVISARQTEDDAMAPILRLKGVSISARDLRSHALRMPSDDPEYQPDKNENGATNEFFGEQGDFAKAHSFSDAADSAMHAYVYTAADHYTNFAVSGLDSEVILQNPETGWRMQFRGLNPRLSDDGRTVLFERGGNLRLYEIGEGEPWEALVVGSPTRGSSADVNASGSTFSAVNYANAALSGNGRYVAFETTDNFPASDGGDQPDDGDGLSDIYLYDKVEDRYLLISADAQGSALAPRLSRNGDVVTYFDTETVHVLEVDLEAWTLGATLLEQPFSGFSGQKPFIDGVDQRAASVALDRTDRLGDYDPPPPASELGTISQQETDTLTYNVEVGVVTVDFSYRLANYANSDTSSSWSFKDKGEIKDILGEENQYYSFKNQTIKFDVTADGGVYYSLSTETTPFTVSDNDRGILGVGEKQDVSYGWLPTTDRFELESGEGFAQVVISDAYGEDYEPRTAASVATPRVMNADGVAVSDLDPSNDVFLFERDPSEQYQLIIDRSLPLGEEGGYSVGYSDLVVEKAPLRNGEQSFVTLDSMLHTNIHELEAGTGRAALKALFYLNEDDFDVNGIDVVIIDSSGDVVPDLDPDPLMVIYDQVEDETYSAVVQGMGDQLDVLTGSGDYLLTYNNGEQFFFTEDAQQFSILIDDEADTPVTGEGRFNLPANAGEFSLNVSSFDYDGQSDHLDPDIDFFDESSIILHREIDIGRIEYYRHTGSFEASYFEVYDWAGVADKFNVSFYEA